MMYRYLTPQISKGFDKYKYSSIDSSPVSVYISHPFWNQCVKLVPRWLAPNLMTFVGFLLIVVNYMVTTYYDPEFFSSTDAVASYLPVPSWVWLMCAVNNFLSHTLDGCDGKQARRTGSSTPLGELFDHGVDSWIVSMLPVILASMFGRGIFGADPMTLLILITSATMTFYVSHWEKYLTGYLFLPWGYDISEFAMTAVFLYTYCYGYTSMQVRVPYIGWTAADLFNNLMLGGCFLVSLPMSIWNIYRSYANKTGKMRSFVEATRPLVSVAILYILVLSWAKFSPSNILYNHPRLMLWMFGTAFSNICCYLIINQMSDTRSVLLHWFLYPLIVITPLVLLTPLKAYEFNALCGYAIFATLAHIHYGTCVVMQLCEKFNIYAFSLQKPKQYGRIQHSNGTKKRRR